ncbi:MAG: hypothetical protein V7724_10140 [Sediminicola sp.]|tara:strand:+ start:16587 stop:16793 length:207 start_codon:yes stop_codon:yes gene_type:complete
MKTKRIIYFLLIMLGAVAMAMGDRYVQKEYALCIGVVLLMFGIQGSISSWNIGGERGKSGQNGEHGQV